MKKLIKISGKISELVLTVLLIAVITATLVDLYSNKTPYRLYTVMSGSMEPALHTGSMIVSKRSPSYSVGDIVTVQIPGTPGETATHRIISTEKYGSSILYQTKGDSNNIPDGFTVIHSQIIGKVIYSLPLAGYFIVFSRTPYGFVLFIVFPATYFVINELRKISIELKRIKSIKYEKKST